MVSHAFWKKHTLVSFSKTSSALVLQTRAILIVFEKLIHACFSKLHSKPYYYLYKTRAEPETGREDKHGGTY
jgi:hypothetical protein